MSKWMAEMPDVWESLGKILLTEPMNERWRNKEAGFFRSPVIGCTGRGQEALPTTASCSLVCSSAGWECSLPPVPLQRVSSILSLCRFHWAALAQTCYAAL